MGLTPQLTLAPPPTRGGVVPYRIGPPGPADRGIDRFQRDPLGTMRAFRSVWTSRFVPSQMALTPFMTTQR
jgi:hypothetical protein